MIYYKLNFPYYKLTIIVIKYSDLFLTKEKSIQETINEATGELVLETYIKTIL